MREREKREVLHRNCQRKSVERYIISSRRAPGRQYGDVPHRMRLDPPLGNFRTPLFTRQYGLPHFLPGNMAACYTVTITEGTIMSARDGWSYSSYLTSVDSRGLRISYLFCSIFLMWAREREGEWGATDNSWPYSGVAAGNMAACYTVTIAEGAVLSARGGWSASAPLLCARFGPGGDWSQVCARGGGGRERER